MQGFLWHQSDFTPCDAPLILKAFSRRNFPPCGFLFFRFPGHFPQLLFTVCSIFRYKLMPSVRRLMPRGFGQLPGHLSCNTFSAF